MGDETLNGMKAIAEYMGVSRTTILRWVHQCGFPAVVEGPGRGRKAFTTKFAISMWVLAMKRAAQYPSGGLPKL